MKPFHTFSRNFEEQAKKSFKEMMDEKWKQEAFEQGKPAKHRIPVYFSEDSFPPKIQELGDKLLQLSTVENIQLADYMKV